MAGATWVNWFCDGRRTVDEIRPFAAAYDAVFVADGATVEALDEPGNPPVHYLPAACDPSIHRPMRARDRFRANVVFAGTATPHRERQLSELVEFGVAVWGPGWRRTKLRDYCRGELLNHEDYIRAYAGASVAINVACCEGEGGRGGAGCEPAAVRARGHRRAPGGRRASGHPPALPRGIGDPGGPKRRVTSGHSPPRRCTTAPGPSRWRPGARQRALTEHTYMHRLASLLRASVGPAPVLTAG